MSEDLLKKITAHCKEYGFVFPTTEIYDGPGALYDYGPYGCELKNNIRQYWWESIVHAHENIVGVDTAILMHPTTWKASGHVDAFNDPLIDNKDSKKRYRADALIEEHLARLDEKIEKEVEKARKRFGEQFNEELFRSTNPRVAELSRRRQALHQRLTEALRNNDLETLRAIITEEEIVCPVSGTKNWTEVRQFNLMFSTQLGSHSDDTLTLYLRPETAQGIFVNFLNVQKSARLKVPFGIAQVGKAFRNEIVARQFIFRMREFEQMEMQFFVRPGTEDHWYEFWKSERMRWHEKLNLGPGLHRFRDHDKLAHYARAACDIEFRFPMGFKELEGIHSRTDYDLRNHQEHSGRKLTYYDPDLNESYIPYVIETSIGLDRMFLAVLTAAYLEEKLPDGSERTVLRFHPALAPVKFAVLPLVPKDGMEVMARKLFEDLRKLAPGQYDEKDSIGRRYRRQDALGTPFAFTVDGQSLVDGTITVRFRDSMEQERIPASQAPRFIEEQVSIRRLVWS
ncbi:MAG: glycine--tRNA ligase [Flavobacteriales bacterium]|nr:glycine--tRNA ligase [Flavobacteriales bacterium]MCX7768058.1 glycine--tRNA ligase [Flavobacteriales bacterium]MDW8409263.1 glycine--tRNA ligase [Flavobacteriales bacterium]